MTVKELIEKLNKLPDNAEVWINYKVHVGNYEWEEVESLLQSLSIETWSPDTAYVHLQTFEEED